MLPSPTNKIYAAIVLAAGLSSRMGSRNKLLVEINQKAMLRHVIDNLSGTTINQIIIVVGHQKEEVRSVIPDSPKIKIVENKKYSTGMASSIRRGVVGVSSENDGCLLCLGDMPYLATEDYQSIIDHFENTYRDDLILVPTFGERWGHPVCFAKKHFTALIQMPFDDSGAKRLILQNQRNVKFLRMDNNHILKDIDELPAS